MYNILLPMIISFLIALVIGPFIIKQLYNFKVAQTEREEGVKAHLEKAGTPTMGGIIFLLAALIVSLFYVGDYPKMVGVIILTYGFGFIGFLDDFLKVILRRSDGLLARQKFVAQIVVTTLFLLYMKFVAKVSMGIKVPFVEGLEINMGVFAYILFFIVILGTVNGVNFTDGLDGLATGVTLPVAGYFLIVTVLNQTQMEPMVAAMIGGLVAFYIYNVHPASIFMGDTGSLALGGFVAACAYMNQMPLHIAIIGLIYLVEVLSVVIQVGYFKITHGKRIFKMAPIHHHYELLGYSETKIVGTFMAITIILCVIGLIGL